VFEEGERWYSQEEIGTFGEAEELELLQDFASETRGSRDAGGQWIVMGDGI